MPFLRLTRDRRGIEHTFLLHAEHGDRPRLLYWYRTAPGVGMGRSAFDEEAIRAIEDRHPDIEFDWPAILALSEVMTPEEEGAAPARPRRKGRRGRDEDFSGEPTGDPATLRPAEPGAVEPLQHAPEVAPRPPVPASPSGLLEELAGREIAARLRGRFAEVRDWILEREVDPAVRERLLTKAQALDPDRWVTPEAVLEGVRGADGLLESLRAELLEP